MAHPKSIVITGANRGIGLQFVREFLATNPSHLIATHRSALGVEGTKELEELSSKHSNLHLLQLDVTDDDKVKEVAKAVEKIVGGHGVNLLINNSGAVIYQNSLDDVTRANLTSLLSVNAIGPFVMLREFRYLLQRAADANKDKPVGAQRAAVAYVSSCMGSIDCPKSGKFSPAEEFFRSFAYRVSKTALNGLAHHTSFELIEGGIATLALHPGWVKTRMGTDAGDITAEESASGMVKAIGSLDESKNGAFLSWEGETVAW